MSVPIGIFLFGLSCVVLRLCYIGVKEIMRECSWDVYFKRRNAEEDAARELYLGRVYWEIKKERAHREAPPKRLQANFNVKR